MSDRKKDNSELLNAGIQSTCCAFGGSTSNDESQRSRCRPVNLCIPLDEFFSSTQLGVCLSCHRYPFFPISLLRFEAQIKVKWVIALLFRQETMAYPSSGSLLCIEAPSMTSTPFPTLLTLRTEAARLREAWYCPVPNTWLPRQTFCCHCVPKPSPAIGTPLLVPTQPSWPKVEPWCW